MRKHTTRTATKLARGKTLRCYKSVFTFICLCVCTGCVKATPEQSDNPTHSAPPSTITIKELTLDIEASSTSVASDAELEISARLCNAGAKVRLIYDGLRWGTSRGIVLYKKRADEDIKLIYVQHSIPPPQAIYSLDNYKRLSSGECMFIELVGDVKDLLGGAGLYKVRAQGVPYANSEKGFDPPISKESVWTLDEGVVTSNIIEILVE